MPGPDDLPSRFRESMMTRPLKRFAITPYRENYRLHMETEGGETFEAIASFEQLDLISEEIDRRLDADEDQELPSGMSG